MTTFSQLVDDIAAESRRPDRLSVIADRLNATIQECHWDDQRRTVLYDRNMVEDEIEITDATAHQWLIPQNFMRMQTAWYPTVYDWDNNIVHPKFLRPGIAMRSENWYYYLSGDRYIFKNPGSVGESIGVAYFIFLPKLAYYAAAARPATYAIGSGWTYHEDYDADDDERETARGLVSNWMLLNYSETLRQGTLAKLWAGLGDQTRGSAAFSQYERLRTGLFTTEQRMSEAL